MVLKMRQIIADSEYTINRQKKLSKAGFESIKAFSGFIHESRQSVAAAIKAENFNYKLHCKIASCFGETLADFWPDLYCIVPIIDCQHQVIHDANVKEIFQDVN